MAQLRDKMTEKVKHYQNEIDNLHLQARTERA